MKALLIASLVLFTLSCSSRDDKMCSCLEAGEKLNKQSEKILNKGVTAEDAQKMIDLREEKKKKCADFQTMSGEEMLKKKETCN